MKRLFFSSFTFLSISMATVAHAADLPVKAPPPAAAPWSWSGFYVGGQVGGLVGTSTFSNPYDQSVFGGYVTTPAFLSGLQLGYNWTVAPRWVVGLEADGDYLVSNGTSTCASGSRRTGTRAPGGGRSVPASSARSHPRGLSIWNMITIVSVGSVLYRRRPSTSQGRQYQ
jgi:hypothetical protein